MAMESRRFSVRTVRLLILLRDGGEITGGDIRSREFRELLDRLVGQGAVSVRRQGSRLRYSAPNREKLLVVLSGCAPMLSDLDAALRLSEGEPMSREDKTGFFGDSKTGGEESSESGFALISSSPVVVRNHGHDYFVDGHTALMVCDKGDGLVLPSGWTVVVVENSRLFFRHDWLLRVGMNPQTAERCFIIKRYPITDDQFGFLKACPLPVRYFGDLDLGGVRIYETEYRRRVGDKISFIVPPDAEERISGSKGNRKLYAEQMKGGLSGVGSPSGELTDLIRIIHKHQSCYEQEGYCHG